MVFVNVELQQPVHLLGMSVMLQTTSVNAARWIHVFRQKCGETHGPIEPHLQTLFATSQTSPKRSQVAAVPHLQTPPEHVSPVTAHVTETHASNNKKCKGSVVKNLQIINCNNIMQLQISQNIDSTTVCLPAENMDAVVEVVLV